MSNSPLHSPELHDFSDLPLGNRGRWVTRVALLIVALVGMGYYVGRPHLSSPSVASEEVVP
ncbi:MAG: hypothetical protein AB7F35_21495 [Acetobacteraceae bacterium]